MVQTQQRRPRVVIIGSGFGGLFAAKALKRADVDVVLVAKTNHHLFQPLLYQVATGILSEGSIAPATREILRRQSNAEVQLGEVVDIDVSNRTVTSWTPEGPRQTSFDSLIVAAGSRQSYFGNDRFAEHAPGLKSIDDALELRGRILSAFEFAEAEPHADRVEQWLTFVIVGAGATGVELAGQISELARYTLRRDFRRIDPARARIILVDAAPMILGTFDEQLAAKAMRRLLRLGVEVRLDTAVVDVDGNGLTVRGADGDTRRIQASTVIWAAGVAASALGRHLADQVGVDVDRAGRIPVEADCSLPGNADIFVVGDMMDSGLPGVAQVAMQSGTYAASVIAARAAGRPVPGPFRYRDKGSMATVSRFSAVASVGRVRISGFAAWLMWLFVHLQYLIGFKQRVTTLLHWLISFLGRGRAERVVTRQQVARWALDTEPHT
ncbi:MAG: FAD-binding protein [Actinomycetales bacterium]|nr:FAD-binding protein [Actinomycetales bacterium]